MIRMISKKRLKPDVLALSYAIELGKHLAEVDWRIRWLVANTDQQRDTYLSHLYAMKRALRAAVREVEMLESLGVTEPLDDAGHPTL